jgi:hypothetical protein
LAVEEIFLGDPATELTARTNQGPCLPEIQPGDKWLFYLRRDEKSHELVLHYGSPSRLIGAAGKDVDRLRRLAAMHETGLVLGYLSREIREVDPDGLRWSRYEAAPRHKVILQGQPDGVEHSAFSDENGVFEFAPLKAGSYRLSTNTTPGLWAEEGPVKVRPRSCTRFDFELKVDASISGRVRSADGLPFETPPEVDIVAEDGSHSHSVWADESGHFEARGLEPARYLVGIGIGEEPGSPEWRNRVYYPGVRTKEQATVIRLGEGETRAIVDFPVALAGTR